MEVTEVRIELDDLSEGGNLRAFADITIDDILAVHGIRVIEGAQGLFIAMPSKKFRVRCEECSRSSDFDSRFCPACGCRMPDGALAGLDEGRRPYIDIVHPVKADLRRQITEAVLRAYQAEVRAHEDSRQSREAC